MKKSASHFTSEKWRMILSALCHGPSKGEYRKHKWCVNSEGGVNRRNFNIEIGRGTTATQVKRLSQKLQEELAVKYPQVQQWMMQYYYPDQKIGIHQPMGDVRYNWGGNGLWEYTISTFREGVEDPLSALVVKQVDRQKEKFVKFAITVPRSLTLQGVETVVKRKMDILKDEWKAKVNQIEVLVRTKATWKF